VKNLRKQKWHWFVLLFTADFPGSLNGKRNDITTDDSKNKEVVGNSKTRLGSIFSRILY